MAALLVSQQMGLNSMEAAIESWGGRGETRARESSLAGVIRVVGTFGFEEVSWRMQYDDSN